MARLLTYDQVQYLVNMEDVVKSVEETFRGHGDGIVMNPTKVTLDVGENGDWPHFDGYFNAMPAYIGYQENAGIKWVGGMGGERRKAGLPFIFGMILLADPKRGMFKAVMDGKYITNLRTGAQTAVALKYLFPEKKSITLGIFGAGTQGRTQTEAISKNFDIEKLYVYDVYKAASEKFAEEMKDFVKGDIVVCDNVDDACNADALITVTIAHEPFLNTKNVKPGTVVFPLGSYSEIEDDLILEADDIVVDHLGQAFHRGALHKLVEEGKLTEDDVMGTIGELVNGSKKIEDIENKRVICLPIGMGCLDIAVAGIVYERAKAQHIGFEFDFNGESYASEMPEKIVDATA